MPPFFKYSLLVFLLLVAFGLRIRGIANTDPQSSAGAPLIDDAFYYFSLGNHLASGDGPRVDAEHNTTGFQPLWGFMVTLPYLMLDGTQGVFGVQMLGVWVGLATCVMIYRFTWQVTQSVVAGLLNAGVWAFAPQTVQNNINGMETSVAVLAQVTLLFTVFMLFTRRTGRWLKITGLACGVGFLARVDTSLMFVALVPLLVAFPVGGQRLRTVATWGIFALLPVLPWVLFALAIGKGPLPESGSAVRTLMSYLGDPTPPPLSLGAFLERDPEFVTFYSGRFFDFLTATVSQIYLAAPLDFLRPTEFLWGNFTRLMLLAAGAWLLSLLVVMWRGTLGLRALVWIYALWLVQMIAAYALVIVVWYFYERYALPLAELFSILILLLLLKGSVSIPVTWLRHVAVALVALYCLAIVTTYYDGYRHDPHYTWLMDDDAVIPNNGMGSAVAWMNANIDPSARVGAFQAGHIGYYADAPIINLDGKVNHAATAAIEAGNMWRYVCQEDLDYVVDWPVQVFFYLIERSENWQDDNLQTVIEFPTNADPVVIYEVNREHCADDG